MIEYDLGTDNMTFVDLEALIEEVYMDHETLEIKKNGLVVAVAIHPDDLAELRRAVSVI